jgi:hypothetical protein
MKLIKNRSTLEILNS